MGENSVIRDAAETVKGIAEAVPVYQDALQPAMREVGKGLQTIAKTIHIALAPICALVWGFDTIKDFVLTRVTEKLRDVPPERIQTPKPNIVCPALEALRYAGHEESLREMYANLLASSLDSATANDAHPAFVQMISSMSPDEARILRLFSSESMLPLIDVRAIRGGVDGYRVILRNFSLIGEQAKCEHPELTPSYLNNLDRLGLVQLPDQGGIGTPHMTDTNCYEPLENSPRMVAIRHQIEQTQAKIEVERRFVEITALGKQFCRACVIEKGLVNRVERPKAP